EPDRRRRAPGAGRDDAKRSRTAEGAGTRAAAGRFHGARHAPCPRQRHPGTRAGISANDVWLSLAPAKWKCRDVARLEYFQTCYTQVATLWRSRSPMRRREFMSTLGGAAVAWPLAARAQQASPVLGFLRAVSPGPFAQRVAAFQQGLRETGYVEGRNVTIDNRWAQERYDRLPALAADLVSRRVDVIVTYTDAAALAAKAATTTIPIVFINGGDPVRAGIVPSLNHPGGNVTGASFFGVDLAAKQLSLLHEFIPNAAVVGFLLD